MKTLETAQGASYRVPTGAEVRAFVQVVNIAAGMHRVSYAQSGEERVVQFLEVAADLETVMIYFVGGDVLRRAVDLIGRDSFAFRMAGCRIESLMSPSWLERQPTL